MTRTSQIHTKTKMNKGKTIRKYYLIQLLINFVTPIIGINVLSFFLNFDSFSKNRLVILSISAAIIFLVLSGLINGINFLYFKFKDEYTSFVTPMIIWSVIILLNIITLINQGTIDPMITMTMIICILNISYNEILRRAIKAIP